MLAEDSYAVVIAQRSGHYPAPGHPGYDYCSRPTGRFHQLVAPSGVPFGEVFHLQLAGPYVAYEAATSSAFPIWLWDTRTSQHNVEQPVNSYAVGAPKLVLSPNGIAARITTYGFPSGYAETVLETLTMTASNELDGASGTQGLANLAVFDCAAACAPATTVVAWTHNGARRYAEVIGGA